MSCGEPPEVTPPRVTSPRCPSGQSAVSPETCAPGPADPRCRARAAWLSRRDPAPDAHSAVAALRSYAQNDSTARAARRSCRKASQRCSYARKARRRCMRATKGRTRARAAVRRVRVLRAAHLGCRPARARRGRWKRRESSSRPPTLADRVREVGRPCRRLLRVHGVDCRRPGVRLLASATLDAREQVCFKFGGHTTSLPRVPERAKRSAWTPCLTLVSLPEHGRTLEKVVADGARRSGSKSNLTSLKSL